MYLAATSIMLAIVALITCSGCMVGPEYQRPISEMPEAFGEAKGEDPNSQSSMVTGAGPAWVNWWTKFGDRRLDSLVTRAIDANHTLRIAVARVQEARAVERMEESRLYPTVSLAASAFLTRGSAAGFGVPYGLPGVNSNLFDVGFDATYEVDLFGGIRRSIEAAGATADATEADRRAVQVSLLAEVARNYIALRAAQRRLVVAHDNLADQQKTSEIVKRRFDNGLAAKFDVVRARAQVVATETSIPPLEADIRMRIHGLSVLLGEPPMALSDELVEVVPIPPVPPEVPVGLPSELLRRRPDIQRAERQLASATAEQGVATAELFPHLILGGTAGVQSRQASDLFSQQPSSGYYMAGPSAEWVFFDGGRRQAGIDRTKARVEGAYAEYEETVLNSLRDVENALTAYSHDQTRRHSLATLVVENEEAVRIAQSQYSRGLVALLDVIEVQRNLYTAQDALALADQAVSSNLVALYKALGGGWETESEAVHSPGAADGPQSDAPIAVAAGRTDRGP